MLSKIIILFFVASVSANSLSKILLERHRPVDVEDVELTLARRIPWDEKISFRAADYPCPAKGYYRHPTNCSRFYMCVNYNEMSPEFTIFLFECNKGDKFVPGINICIPGKCSNRQSEPAFDDLPGQTEITDVISQPDGVEISPDATDPGTSPDATDPGSTPDVGDVGSNTGMESSQTATDGESSPVPSKGCIGMYQAHSSYCNHFHRCDSPIEIYKCGAGTVFSEAKQMCRLYMFNKDLCTGKEIYTGLTFKSESPFDLMFGLSPTKSEYPDKYNLATDPLFSSLSIFNPSTNNEPAQDYSYSDQDRIEPFQKYLPQQGINEQTKSIFDNWLLRTYSPYSSLNQNNFPTFNAINTGFQQPYYNIPKTEYSQHRPNIYSMGDAHLNPYNNFYRSFHPTEIQFPNRNVYEVQVDDSMEDDD